MQKAVPSLFASIALAACNAAVDPASSARDAGDPTGSAAAAPTTTVVDGGAAGALPCDVDDVLARRCRQCHGANPAFGAPMPLVTFADTEATSSTDPSRKTYELVARRIHDEARPMPQPPNARLDAMDTATIDAWVAGGARAGAASSCASSGDAGTDGSTGLSCTPDVHMRPASTWSMPQAADDLYVCYGFDVTVTNKRHLIGIAPKIDNASIIHHLVLYETPAAVTATPGGCDLGQLATWRIVYGWAPGAQNFDFPPEAGYPIEQTTHYVAQIHYNNVKHLAGQKDASGFDFCTTETLRPNDADALIFGTSNISIPPHGSLDITCRYTMGPGIPPLQAFSAFPHMHQLGRTISTVKLADDAGTQIDLGARPVWDFANQIYLPLKATLNPGDVIQTRCRWDNPSSQAVRFGPASSDEMCFSYTLFYPRVLSSGWNWSRPSDESTCSPTQ